MNTKEQEAAKVFLSHRDYVKGQALRFAPLPSLTEDILQQAFLEFVLKADHWDLSRDVRPLLLVVVKNIALRYWREKTRTMPDALAKVAERLRICSEQSPENSPYEDDLDAMKKCIALLPEEKRILIELHYFEGLPIKDIAEKLEMKPDTIYHALFRIRENLRQSILRLTREGETDA